MVVIRFEPICLLYTVIIPVLSNIPTKTISNTHIPITKCKFSVHKQGPNGEEIVGTNLNSELFYKIKCEPEVGYCLHVANCTVSSNGEGQRSYRIIDENGCTREPNLFEHVQYEDDYTAGIYNPLPIRFRGSSSAVQFFCVTTYSPLMNGKCDRNLCTWNEYTAKYNSKDD